MPVYGTIGGSINASQLPVNLPVWFGIRGNLMIDQNTNWSGKLVYMFSGSSTVVNSGTAFNISGSVLEGCDKMWGGILLPGNASFSMTGGRISDATSAVETSGINNLSISGGATLTRNFYGLNLRNARKKVVPSLSNLTINGTGPLKAAYPGQPIDPDLQREHGQAGITVSGLVNFTLAPNLSVIINKCEYGVEATYSNGNIQGIKFTNIFWTALKPTGKAVGAKEGNYQINQCVFQRRDIGRYLVNTTFSVSNNVMENMDGGIICSNSYGGSVNYILGNQITNTFGGIEAILNPNCTIEISAGNIITNASGTGIFVTDFLMGGSIFSSHKILNSTITLRNNSGLIPQSNAGATGIYVAQVQGLGGGAIKVCSNIVGLPGTNTETVNIGILVVNGHSLDVSKNEITQTTQNAAAEHTGIKFLNTDRTFLGCNGVNYTNVGIQTSGNCYPVALHTNRFIEHDEAGLKVSGRLYTFFNGQHIHQGNRWLYATNANRPGAVSNMFPSENALWPFIVDGAENSKFLPYVVGNNWFRNQINPALLTRTCAASEPGCAGFVTEATFDESSALIAEVLANQAPFSLLSPALRWQIEADVLTMMADNGMDSQPDWTSFWSSRYATTQGVLARMHLVPRPVNNAPFCGLISRSISLFVG